MTAAPLPVLICNAGFEDVLSLGRQNRADPYAQHVGPSPWPRWLPDARRLGVAARMAADGSELVPFDSAQAEALGARLAACALADGRAPQAVAICLLHAQANPAHELAVARQVALSLPGARIQCSHALPRPPDTEFERTVAAVRAVWGEDAPREDERHAAPRQPGFAGKLEAIADAMQDTVAAQAVSSIAREAMDCACAIFAPDGRMIAQARSLPLLLGSLSPAVRGLLQVHPVRTLAEGDVLLSNDPWSGGTHLPDFTVLAPVWHEGRVQALVACILHHQDVGGIAPGSVPTDATSIQQEGLRIAPVKLRRGGRIDEDLMRLLRANSRMPEALAGDLAAQMAALALGAARLGELIAGLGEAGFASCAARTLADSEAATRAALAAAPDGDHAFDDALDGDGLDDTPVSLRVVLRKRGDSVEIDLRECADQTRGPVNASRGAVWAAVSYFARMLAPQAASNDGCTAPITLLSRHGSIVDPAFPAALNARTNLVKLLANALVGAWAQARPQASPAPNAAVAVVLSLAGRRDDGSAWVFTEIIASAAGGAPWGPGGSGVATDVGNTRNTPVEVIERQAPVRMERVVLRRGSGGAGTHAGGDGVVRVWHLLEGTGTVSCRGERHRIAAQGAAGGLPGQCGSARIERADGRVEWLPAKARVEWSAGDRLIIETAGAGGWGPPPQAGAPLAGAPLAIQPPGSPPAPAT